MTENKELGFGWKQKVEMTVGYGKWAGSTVALVYALSNQDNRFAVSLGICWTAHNIGWSVVTNLYDRVREFNPRKP